MSTGSRRSEVVSLAYRRWLRDGFDAMFREGTDLTNAVAEYLDGPGRQESAILPRWPKAMYRTESLRLTTLLTQLMGWLFVQRAIKEYAKVTEFEKSRIRPVRLIRLNAEHMTELPEQFVAFAERTNTLLQEIVEADALFSHQNDTEPPIRASG